MKNKKDIKIYLYLNLLLCVYSFSGVLSKLASEQKFLSFKFFLCYCGMIFLLVIYAFFWQQIIKKMPLTNAYANKAVAIIWGILCGMLFFNEKLTVGKVIGSILIIIGIVLFALNDKKEKKDE